MPDKPQPPPVLDPLEDTQPANPDLIDVTEVRGPLHVEKLEGRQESGRDAQDEAEEDEAID